MAKLGRWLNEYQTHAAGRSKAAPLMRRVNFLKVCCRASLCENVKFKRSVEKVSQYLFAMT